jgi:hypothetical protein
MSSPIRILVKGMNWSGSGAVVDYIKEFRGIVQAPGGLQVKDPTGESRLGEFNYFRLFGGVGDQIDVSHGMVHPSILRSEINMIRELMTFKGKLKLYLKSLYHGQPVNLLANNKVIKQLQCIGTATQALIADFEKGKETSYRLEKSREWIEKIAGCLCNKDTKALLFDQPVNIGQHDSFWAEVFKPFRLILVMRNPRDQFSQMANHRDYFSRHYRTAIAYLQNGWGYEDAVRFRIESKKNEEAAIDRFLSQSKDALLISFEEMVLDYDRATAKIREFAGLDSQDHIYPRKYFNPEVSKKNIGIYLNNKIKLNDASLSGLCEWYDRHTDYLSVNALDKLVRGQ